MLLKAAQLAYKCAELQSSYKGQLECVNRQTWLLPFCIENNTIFDCNSCPHTLTTEPDSRCCRVSALSVHCFLSGSPMRVSSNSFAVRKRGLHACVRAVSICLVFCIPLYVGVGVYANTKRM